MATIEDAINAYIRYCEKQKHSSPLHNQGMDIWIRVLKSAPRDLSEIQKVIDGKEQQRKIMLSVEQAQPIFTEIQALEWMCIIVRSSDKEHENWSKLA